MKILLVDDDPLVLRAVNRALKSRGFETRAYSDHRDALITAKLWAEVALVDVDMPVRSGPELAELFPARLPVVFYTGNPQAVPQGAWFVEKPAAVEKIVEALSAAVIAAKELAAC